jgi:hypothetical protein
VRGHDGDTARPITYIVEPDPSPPDATIMASAAGFQQHPRIKA